MGSEDTAAFTQKIYSVYNQSYISMGIEIGSRLGIFDHLIKSEKPQTCKEIADALGLKERYVKEWLGLVCSGGIVDIADGRYSIPAHRVPVLSSTSRSNGVSFSWMVGMCSRVADDVIDCFKLDGPKGVPYSRYPLLHPWREATMKCIYTENAMLKHINLIPGLLAKLEEGTEMCDLGCSSGVVVLTFAKRFPKTQVYGYDISDEAIKAAKQKADALGIHNAHFAVQDCCDMPAQWSNRWDYIYTYDVIHDVPDTTKILSEICRVLKPGSAATIIDINMHSDIADNVKDPFSTLTYGASLFHCVPVSLYKDGMGLGATWGIEKAEEMIKEAGFSKVEKDTEQEAIFICYR